MFAVELQRDEKGTKMKNKSLLARVVAGFFIVAMYCVNTVAITGFALT